MRETVHSNDRGDGTIFYRLAKGKRVSPNLYIAYRAQKQEHVVSAGTGVLAVRAATPN